MRINKRTHLMKIKKLTDFFGSEYLDFASYNNYRMLACYIDGYKPSSRKVYRTMTDKNYGAPKKVDQISSVVTDYCNYIHGSQNLCNVVVGMARDYTGSNNIPTLTRNGYEHTGKSTLNPRVDQGQNQTQPINQARKCMLPIPQRYPDDAKHTHH